jgi:hypothetical protein
MSKNVQENISTFLARINKVLIDKGFEKKDGTINYSKAERITGISTSTLSKLAQREGELGEFNKEKFLRTFGVNRDWLDTGKGDIYGENPTQVDKPADITENRDDVYRRMVEENSEYKLVPSTLLSGEYRIVLAKEIEQRDQLLKELLNDKNRLIKVLEDEIKMLRSGELSKKAN